MEDGLVGFGAKMQTTHKDSLEENWKTNN